MYEVDWILNEIVGAGKNPRRKDDLETALREILDQGVTRIICLDDKCSDTPNCLNNQSCILHPKHQPLIKESTLLLNEIWYEHIPVKDFAAPTMEQMQMFCHQMDESIENDIKTLVHCGAGIGRTGTMLCAYLVWKGETPEKAIENVAGSGQIHRGPEVNEQVEALRNFARYIAKD
jgi:hypothetical protein